MTIQIRKMKAEDRKWVDQLIRSEWGAEIVVARGKVHRPSNLQGLVALRGNAPVGLLTYNIEKNTCEIVTLNALDTGVGVGTALLENMVEIAKNEECKRIWVITTNDNLNALRFYQKRGFRIAAVHCGAVDEARKLKPQIPKVGMFGIPLHDEIELHMIL